MLFSILIGIVSTLVFFGRQLFLKIKFILSGGKAEKISSTKIPYVIFSDHKRYWNVFKPICDEFEKRGVDLVYWTASSDDPALSEKYEHVKTEFIGEGNKAFARLNMMNAGICLSTTPGLDVYQWKRSKNVNWYVHIPHSLDEMMGYRMFGLDFYDAVLLTGDFQGEYIRRLEVMRGTKEKELVTVGYPPMDEQRKRLDLQKNINTNKITSSEITVLVAPSWGKTAILSKFGADFLVALQKTGFKIVIRPHPQTLVSEKQMLDSLRDQFPDTENFRWNFDNDNFACMNDASILITDFSGIIFDFAILFDRPIIYADTEYDSAPYDSAWFKNETLWRFEILKKIGIKLVENQFSNMRHVIEKAMNDSSLMEGRDEVRKQAWMYPGESSGRIVDYLFEKNNFLINSKEFLK
ncbi:MAG: CDP-glycerol glycerophosphotransferase family protein [Treponema sp.]|nr:CDP-glycerol glycerophosphotransferase family protein [Treponema sp.]